MRKQDKENLEHLKNFDSEKKYKYKLITYDETSLSEDIEIIKYEDFIFDLKIQKNKLNKNGILIVSSLSRSIKFI